MRFVVDVNVVISSLMKDGISFKVFSLNSILQKFEFIAPDFFMSEISKHKEELLHKSKLPEEVFFDTMDFLFEQINIVPAEEFKEFVPQAEKVLSNHMKDVPYVALALKLDCPIFSGDKILKNLSPVKVCSPRELFDLLTAA